MALVQTISHNLANPDHFQMVTSKLGGEAMIRKKYPELFKILMHSRNMAEKKMSESRILRSVGSSGGNSGFEDFGEIRTLDYAAGKISSSSEMGTVKEMPTLAIIGEITDVYRSEVVDNCALYDSNSHYLESAMSALSAGSEQYNYKAEMTFTKIDYDQEGKPIITSSTSTQATNSESSPANIVKKIVVTDPQPYITHADETIIFYNNRKGPGCDYYYNNVSQYDNHVRVMIPFSGSVEFNPPFVPQYVDKNNGLTLRIETKTNGAVQFGMEGWKDIKWIPEKNSLSWIFPEDWRNYISRIDFNNDNHADFYCRMAINYSIGGSTSSHNTVPIIISSKDSSQSSGIKKIPRLHIMWGCFAENTKIKMADSSMKRICQIKTGERVMTGSGAAAVTEIITGYETKITVIATSGGKTLRVSSDHPILTSSGWKTADNLTAADVLKTESGLESIEALYISDYNDKVFSLKTDGDGSLIADGIFAGDFGQQNKPKEPTAKKPLNEFQEEFADLMQNLAKKQEELHG